MGQDLHDGSGSQRTGIAAMLRTIAADARKENPNLAERIQQTEELVNESSEDVRRLSRGLNPPTLAEGDFTSALERLATNTSSDSPSCPLKISEELPAF